MLTGLKIGLNSQCPVGQLAKKLTSPSQKYHFFFLIPNEMAHVCIGDSTVMVIYYNHTILNVYHVYV